ncbi:MAG: hypothetical protein ACP5HM_02795, partial [Anaerolineae bacterium]
LISGWNPRNGSKNKRTFRCKAPTDEFLASYVPGGNVTDLTTAYGFSPYGDAVRVTWSDGQVDVVLLENNSFLCVRPETSQVKRIELLDTANEVLESKEWNSGTQ